MWAHRPGSREASMSTIQLSAPWHPRRRVRPSGRLSSAGRPAEPPPDCQPRIGFFTDVAFDHPTVAGSSNSPATRSHGCAAGEILSERSGDACPARDAPRKGHERHRQLDLDARIRFGCADLDSDCTERKTTPSASTSSSTIRPTLAPSTWCASGSALMRHLQHGRTDPFRSFLSRPNSRRPRPTSTRESSTARIR
jgi:hypothetical protein